MFVMIMISNFLFNLTNFCVMLFFTASLSLPKSTGIGTNLSISNLSTSVIRLAKFDFSAELEVSISVAFFKFVFVA